jgi:hypothetical protein
MKSARCCAVAVLLLCLTAPLLAAPAAIQTPPQFLGFEVGADRKLADYHQIVSYFKMLAANSHRIEIENLGATTLGNEFILAAISSEENLKNKKHYQEIARTLADPRGLTPQELDALVKQGKAIVLVTCNIHSTEIGSSQMAMEWAHALVTADDPETRHRLDNVILLLVPSLNPDGQIMEVEWYRKNLGTPYEGSRMPWLYHPYVGHDNNRDWYMLTQKETQAMTRAVYHQWFPQVWLDEHQMGSSGPRLFVPPYTDPIAASIDPLMWRGINVIGTTMAWRLEQQHKSGVVYGYAFDQYWPGATEGTPEFKNIFGLLTEAASARLATPIELPNTELSAGGKGLTDYRVTANFPNPWPGGTWRLRDIMDYERLASDALLETAAYHKEDFMRGTAEMAMAQVRSGKPDQYWRIPRRQADSVTAARLAFLLRDQGVQVLVGADGSNFLVPTAQPYGRYASELLGTQRYPQVRVAPGQQILSPYDITAWSLPLLMDVAADKVVLPAGEAEGARPITDADWPEGGLTGSGPVYALSHRSNNAIRLVNAVLKNKGPVEVARERFDAGNVNYPAGTFLVGNSDGLAALAQKFHLRLEALPQRPKVAGSVLREVRVGLYKPWLASIDEGWTRWVLEQYGFNLKNLDNKAVKAGNLSAAFDAIILPDVKKDIILEGKPKMEDRPVKYWEELPPEYAGGIGKEGVKALKEFVEKGGTLITLESSGDLVADEFNLPVGNALAKVKRDDFFAPGSLLRIQLDPNNPISYGMPEQAVAFVAGNIAYQTTLPGPALSRSIVASYPADSEDILLSGYLKGADMLARRAAAVRFTMGKGKLVMFGFGVQHRGQTEGTFKLLFNAIYLAGMTDGAQPTAAGGH